MLHSVFRNDYRQPDVNSGGAPSHLPLLRRFLRDLRTSSAAIAAIGPLLAASTVLAQDAPKPAFEAASVKVSESAMKMAMTGGRAGMKVDGARVDCRSLSLQELMAEAYRVRIFQVTGPDWIRSEQYDIQASIPRGSNPELVPEMLQALLADRFRLTFHREQKEQPVYALIVGKNGLQLQPVAADATPDGDEDTTESTGTLKIGGGGRMMSGTGGGAVKMAGAALHIQRKMTLGLLAELLGRFVDRPVVDLTEVKGTYDIGLDVPLADVLRSAGANMNVNNAGAQVNSGAVQALTGQLSDGGGPTIFTSVQKLGLKLDPRKLPTEIIVVDRAEKIPTEN